VPDEDLSAWYSGAACLAWPSLYEGFGFPPLEAMACGCPVVVSTAGSLPEIAGPAALLVEPRDERALADAIRTLILDPPSDLIERGLAHAARFSWDRTARETLRVYETLLERGSRLDPDPPPDREESGGNKGRSPSPAKALRFLRPDVANRGVGLPRLPAPSSRPVEPAGG